MLNTILFVFIYSYLIISLVIKDILWYFCSAYQTCGKTPCFRHWFSLCSEFATISPDWYFCCILKGL